MARAWQRKSVTVTRTRTRSKPSSPSVLASKSVSKRGNTSKDAPKGQIRCFNCGKYMGHR